MCTMSAQCPCVARPYMAMGRGRSHAARLAHVAWPKGRAVQVRRRDAGSPPRARGPQGDPWACGTWGGHTVGALRGAVHGSSPTFVGERPSQELPRSHRPSVEPRRQLKPEPCSTGLNWTGASSGDELTRGLAKGLGSGVLWGQTRGGRSKEGVLVRQT